MKYDLMFEGGVWWAFDPDSRDFVHSFDFDDNMGVKSVDAQKKAFCWAWNLGNDIQRIVNEDRNMETWESPRVISVVDWDGNEHWMVVWEYSDGEIAQFKSFSTQEEAKRWLFEFA